MRTATWRILGAAIVVLGASLTIPVAPAEAAGPIRILLVGDSITEGTDGDTGYRCDLWNTLSSQYAIDFVGGLSYAGDCGGTFDTDHDGRGGATTAERIDEMDPNSFALSYEAALVHIGTNDQNGINFAWTQSYVSGTLEPTYRNLVAKLRQNNPTVTIYLSRLIPCGLTGDPGSGYLGCAVTLEGGLDNNGQPVEGMNDVWARIAADSSTPQSPIVLVDHWAGFNVTNDLKADKVHPNASGRAKMAAKWAQALAPQLSADDTADKVLLVEPNGRWHIRRSGQGDRTFWYGTPGDVPLFGDWNGDGLATPGAWRQGPGGGYAYLTNTLPADGQVGVAEFFFYFGIPGDQVFVGDWNGDNRDTLGINRNGHIFLTDTNGSGGQPVPTNYDFWFGAPGDRAFGGDADGNGRDAVFLYRSSDGFVYYTNQTPEGPAVIVANDFYYFGLQSDRFVAGDWNEDGVDTAGIFRPSNTTMYLSNTNASGGAPAPTDIAYTWGSAGWTPVAGRWN
jgi:lysophospholipase L1-like esterase